MNRTIKPSMAKARLWAELDYAFHKSILRMVHVENLEAPSAALRPLAKRVTGYVFPEDDPVVAWPTGPEGSNQFTDGESFVVVDGNPTAH